MLLKPVALLTSKCLRKVGLPQSVHIGTVYTNNCGASNNRPVYPAKVRFGFIPDEWFGFFYSKTGITGPYIFGLGLLNYLFSKEIYVCDHEFYNGLAIAIMSAVAVKKLGPRVAKYCDDEIEKVEQEWKKMHNDELQALEDLIEHERREQWRAEGSLLLMELKKQNIALQLEEAYRKAMMKVNQDVINRLDYQVACRNVEARVNHKHMVQWVVDKVLAALPKSDDDAVAEKRRSDLTAMALRIKD